MIEVSEDGSGARYMSRDRAMFHENFVRVSLDQNHILPSGEKFKHALLRLRYDNLSFERDDSVFRNYSIKNNSEIKTEMFLNLMVKADSELLDHMTEECDKGRMAEEEYQLKQYLMEKDYRVFKTLNIEPVTAKGEPCDDHYQIMISSTGEITFAASAVQSIAHFDAALPSPHGKTFQKKREAYDSSLQKKWEDFIDPLIELFIQSERGGLVGTKLEKDSHSEKFAKPWCRVMGEQKYDDLKWDRAQKMVEDFAKAKMPFVEKEFAKNMSGKGMFR